LASITKARLTEAEVSARAGKALLWTIAITVAIYLIPYGDYIGHPLVLLSTLVHELGHGVAAEIVGGNFEEFKMYWNGAGVAPWTHTGNVGPWGMAFVSAGGLCGPAVGAAICFIAGRRATLSRYTLGLFGFLLILAEILVVRSTFGFVFVAALAAILLALAFWASDDIAQFGLLFFGVQLALAVFSRSDYLFVESAGVIDGKVLPSDTKQMEMALGLPYWFWGGLCAAFSIAVLALGAWMFLRPSSWRRRKR
jgi:hypothetical protein